MGDRTFSSYHFIDITEQFLLDYAFWIKGTGIKNGNKGGLTTKLGRLRALCNYAYEEGMCGVNYVFTVFTHKHTTSSKRQTRVKQISQRVSKTLFNQSVQDTWLTVENLQE